MSAEAPKAYRDFINRFPQLGEAWDLMREAGKNSGSLDTRSQLLVKLGIAVGSGRSGAVSSATRKALKGGVSAEEIEQVIALAASTVGMPASVAALQWSAEARLKLSKSDRSTD
jgi:4-carboxymuconolactone decarboxylase